MEYYIIWKGVLENREVEMEVKWFQCICKTSSNT